MKRIIRIVSALLACAVVFLWFKVLTADRPYYIEVPRVGNHRDYIGDRRYTRRHVALMSDRRGIVFDVFIQQIPPEKAPGPPGSEATQRWMKPRAERTASAYSRHFGFEKGIEHRHGQYLNDPIYFYGTDYYVAVPHWLVIFLFALPALWPLRHRLRCRVRSDTKQTDV